MLNVYRNLLVVALLFACLCVGSAAAQDDPTADGWTTEAISNSATLILKKVGTAIVDASNHPDKTRFENISVFDDFAAFMPKPAAVTPVFTSQQFAVRRATESTRQIDRFSHFVKVAGDGISSVESCAFKIVGIVRQADTLKTRVKVAIHGKSDHRIVEQNHEWDVEWLISKNDLKSLRLSKIRIVSFEETRLKSSNRGPLFQDETTQVFGELESFWKQLAYGQPYWLRRIESIHGMLNPAQNGMSVGDVNGDGFDDIYICQPGGLPNRMYLREPTGQLRDISKTSGTDLLDNTHAALWIDFDNDGDQDLVASTSNAILFFEHFSPLRFRLKVSLEEMRDCYTLAAADFDNDGDLDVYACGYFRSGADVQSLPVPVPYFDARNGGSNYLIRNERNWQVSDATAEVALSSNNDRFSYAALWFDYDQDGDQDLYVANDFGRDNLFENRMEKNRVRFVDVSEKVGLTQGAFGMSVSAADLNRDGFDDLYVANMYSSAGNRITNQPAFRPNANVGLRNRFRQLAAGNSLLMNRTATQFENIADAARVDMGRWSWGANFVDLNNDGLEDLLVTNGYISGKDPDDL